MKKLFIYLMIIPLFIACDNNDDEIQSYVKLGTFQNLTNSTNFIFTTDDNSIIKVVNSDVKYYRPKQGQRAIMEFVILPGMHSASSYQYEAKMLDVYEVLTKNIFNISPSTQDSIGNDPIGIRNMWVAKDYLNVEFVYPGYSKTHFVNLVLDASETHTDNKVHLEFRHNANNDYPSYNITGMVSFNLNSLRKTGSNSVNFVVHYNEFSSGVIGRKYEFTYIYGSNPALAPINVVNIPEKKAIIN